MNGTASPKVYVSGGNVLVSGMFKERGWQCVNTIEEADLVQLCGGADIDPSIYQQFEHKLTHKGPEDRDITEMFQIELAKNLGKPIAGICRGAQLLWVLNGGSLFQHVNGHRTNHYIYSTLDSSELFLTTSSHHQMMKETKETSQSADVLAHAISSTNREWMGSSATMFYQTLSLSPARHTLDVDIEVALFKKDKILCFQPHPEYNHGVGNTSTRDYYFDLLWKYLLNKG